MRKFLGALLLCFAAAAPVAAATVTITGSFMAADVSGFSDIDTSPTYGPRTLTSSDAGSSATTFINWQETSGGALFDFDFAHVRGGTGSAYAQSYGSLVFTVDSDTTYSLSGLYSMTGPANVVYSLVYLQDVTEGTAKFEDQSYSTNTANEFFLLGEAMDGDSINFTAGSLTGTLLAGHSYEFYHNNYIQAVQDDDGATATGCLTLSIGGAPGGDCGVPAVPLPAAAWLLLSGLGGLGFLGRRRKAA